MKNSAAYLSFKRSGRLKKLAGLVRPDISGAKLRMWQTQGYSQVVFVANVTADPECATLNGNLYNIEDIIDFDNPLYRTSHVNCNCAFTPYEPSKR